jgi:hypothetical protein
MKLFQSLLVAPAVLGFIVPVTAKATETNLDAISNYYQDNIDLNSKSFISNTDNKTLLLSGGEGLVESTSSDPVVDDSFSSTTTASFGVNFYVGAVDSGSVATSTTTLTAPQGGGTVTSATTAGTAAAEAVTFSYDFAIDLETSFTGEDSLEIAIEAGNAGGTPIDGFMGGDNTSDALKLDGVSYTFPLGDSATVIVGDGVGVDDLNTGACAYSAFTDLISDCGANEIGGSADSAIAIGYDFGNGFTMAGGIGGGTGTAGYFTEEDASTIGVEAAYTADTYGVAVAYTDDEATTYWTINAMLAPEGFPSISVGYETDDDDADAIFAGLTFSDVGPGSVSLGMASTATASTDFYQYELSYSYPLNDGMTITPGVFITETSGEDDTGFAVTTSFSF